MNTRIQTVEPILQKIIYIAKTLKESHEKLNSLNELRGETKEDDNTLSCLDAIDQAIEITQHISKNFAKMILMIKSKFKDQGQDAFLNSLVLLSRDSEKSFKDLNHCFSLLRVFSSEYDEMMNTNRHLNEYFIELIDRVKVFLIDKAQLEQMITEKHDFFEQFEIVDHSGIIPEFDGDGTEDFTYGNPFEELGQVGSRFLSVGGGKGGTGKTTVASNLALIMASRGKKVVIVDVDLGAANLHTCVGVKYPPVSLTDFLYGQAETIEDVLIDTYHPNLKLISGAKDILQLANMPFTLKTKLLNNLKKIRADLILLDLGSGSTYNVIDFFRFARESLLIISPEPTSIENVSTFLKKSVYRELTRSPLLKENREIQKMISRLINPEDLEVNKVEQVLSLLNKKDACLVEDTVSSFSVKLIVNRLRTSGDMRYGQAVRMFAEKYLSLSIEDAGFIREDSGMSEAVRRFTPFYQIYPKSPTSIDLKKVAYQFV